MYDWHYNLWTTFFKNREDEEDTNSLKERQGMWTQLHIQMKKVILKRDKKEQRGDRWGDRARRERTGEGRGGVEGREGWTGWKGSWGEGRE